MKHDKFAVLNMLPIIDDGEELKRCISKVIKHYISTMDNGYQAYSDAIGALIFVLCGLDKNNE